MNTTSIIIYALVALFALTGMIKSRKNSFSYFLFGWSLALMFSQLIN